MNYEKQLLIDEVASSSFTYIGYALPNTDHTESKWQIARVSSPDSATQFLYANGISSFTNIWDERTTYTYTISGA